MTGDSIRVENLNSDHRLSEFDCGAPALDDWLKRFALANQAAGATRTYVAARGDRVVSYYALAAGSVARAEATDRVARGLARHPVPVVIIARLAVDRGEQGKGLGAAMLKDALSRVLSAADIVGVRAVLVHAKDESARAFYQHFEFESSPIDPFQMLLLIKDLKRSAGLG